MTKIELVTSIAKDGAESGTYRRMKKFPIGPMPFVELAERTGVVLERSEALERLSVRLLHLLKDQVELPHAGGVRVRLVAAFQSRCGGRALPFFCGS